MYLKHKNIGPLQCFEVAEASKKSLVNKNAYR